MSDNNILVQEIIRIMVCKTGPKGHVALKLDLDKVYDRLEWSFIQETLAFFQIPPSLIKLIMNMISLTCFHIMWNGSPLPDIVPSRGGALSPYLFIFVLGMPIHSFGRGSLG